MTRRLAPHVAVHAVLLAVAVGALLRPATTFTVDEGVYGTQVVALADGDWSYRPPSAVLDPAGRFYPVPQAVGDGAERVVYGRHPAYPLLLHGIEAVGGRGIALTVPGIAGAVVAAASAWCMARRLAPGREALAYWITAASPLAFHAGILWGHALAAGLTGAATAAVLGALARAGPRRNAWWAAGAVSLCAAVLVRSEAQLYAAALVVAVVLHGTASRRREVVVAGGALAAAVAATVLSEIMWVRAVVGPDGLLGVRRGSEGFVLDRLEGFRNAVLGASLYDDVNGALTVLALAAAAAGVVSAGRAGRWSPVAVVLVGAGAVVYAARIVADPIDPVTGLVAGWPVVVFVPWAWRRSATPAPAGRRVVGLALAGFAGAVLATQYPDGGALQWGGRFFSPAFPALGALAAAASGRLPGIGAPAGRRLAVAAAAVPAVLALVCLRQTRLQHDDLVDLVSAEQAELVVAFPRFLPPAMWRDDDRSWLQVDGEEALADALQVARTRGVANATLVWLAGPAPATPGWDRRLVGVETWDVHAFAVYRLDRTA